MSLFFCALTVACLLAIASCESTPDAPTLVPECGTATFYPLKPEGKE